MRGFTLRAVPVCFVVFAVGCFTTNSEIKQTEVAPRTPTHAYWRGVNAALSQRPTGNDLASMLQVVRAQTNTLRELPTEGVDETLVAAVNEVIRNEDEVLRLGDMVGGEAAELRKSKEMAGIFGAANKRAADAKKRLRGLRDALNARHGGDFAVLGG